MIQNEVPIPAEALQWKCIEYKIDSERLHYGRFAISPLRPGQANTVGIAIRRALLGEIEGTSITYAKFERVTHEYSTIIGIQESVHDISINLKEIVLKSNSYETQKASISIIGPKKVTAQDIILPPSIRVIDATQYIATITKAVFLNIELRIKKDRGYRIQNPTEYENGYFAVNAISTPIRNANYSVHSFENEKQKQEILFIEIWTNGSLTPKEALHEASRSLINLFIPLLHEEEQENHKVKNKDKSNMIRSSPSSANIGIGEIRKEISFKHIFIDQLELPARAYNGLKRVNVHTISDLLNYSQEDSMKIKNFGEKSIEQVIEALQKHFAIHLPRNKFSIND
uniref:DNA-directed RNA polymerase subunit alpha n=1 Tax=Leiosporoceros dussii TaxID=263836 RepID=A0A385KE36_9EMBR|nr:alpha subunit of RNA polymerase [Leiosporoceros dussii]AXZ70934.1 alpha subunit of RNA polymerase [Leiosporoceros dussii]